jgi:hypothetical protein
MEKPKEKKYFDFVECERYLFKKYPKINWNSWRDWIHERRELRQNTLFNLESSEEEDIEDEKILEAFNQRFFRLFQISFQLSHF